MPREQAHWTVLNAAHKRGHVASIVTQSIALFPAAAQLGSIAHDAPYFADFGRSAEFTAVAERLHGGEGEDTFEPMRQLVHRVQQMPHDESRLLGISCIAGMLSHIATDQVFHPLVYYITGNYYAEEAHERRRAQYRHRLFEVYLDQWYLRTHLTKPTTIASLLDTLGPRLSSIENLLSLLGGREVWQVGFRDMATLQSAFVSPIAGAGIRLLNFILGGRLSHGEALVQFGRRRHYKILDRALSFKNPVTGEDQTVSLLELHQAAVLQTLAHWDWLEQVLQSRENPRQYGASLNFGLVKAKKDDAKYFSKTGITLPGLVIS